MVEFESGGRELAKIHKKNNDRKFFCHFTGFLEGIAASGHFESGEIGPLIEESIEFVQRVADCDAFDIVEDFKADILELETITDAVRIRLIDVDPICEKSQLNRFLGYCRGIACDNVIRLEEASGVLEFIEKNPALRSVVGVRQIETTCLDAVADGIVAVEESNEICEAITNIVGDTYGDTGLAQTTGVANYQEYRIQDLELELSGTRLVLTGSFRRSPRSVFEDELREYGAEVDRSVSGKTDFLVVGGEAARDWIELNRGTKIRKAQELRQRSQRPEFVSEAQLLQLMGLLP